MTSEQVLPRRVISNSEVGAWLKCRASYRYQYDLSLQPLRNSDALELGSLVHELLEQYYLKRIHNNASPHEVAVQAVHEYAQNFMRVSGNVLDLQKAIKLVLPYLEWAKTADTNWEILEVERKYEMALTEDFVYALKLDLLIRDHADMGRLKIVDHKTTYDFWSEDDFALNAQFPKYVGALRFNKINVESVIVNQIRTRVLKQPTAMDLYRREEIKYSDVVVRRALQEQIIASEEIMQYRDMPEAARERKALRIMNKYNCKGCGVRSLCTAEFQGSSLDYIIQNEYKRNEYDASYNPAEGKGELESW